MPEHAEQQCNEVLAWHATHDHPRGLADTPSFEVIGSMVYRVGEHVSSEGSGPWYQLRDGYAYPVDGHPHGTSAEPAFRVDGTCVYPASMDVVATDVPAWFEIRPGT